MVLLALLLAGCSGRQLELDKRWAPLERVVESSVWPKGRTTTIGPIVYTRDLADWEKTYPTGPRRDAVLLHEQEHARRQAKAGLPKFLARYAREPKFMWEEERRGWALQLRHLASRGVGFNPDEVAAVLARYKTLIGGEPMVSLAEARAWVRSGTWRK